MAGYVIMGALAAFGLFCGVWAVIGWILPVGKGCAFVCLDVPDAGLLSRYKWLRETGLLSCPLLVVTEKKLPESQQFKGIEICSRTQLLSRLELERKEIDGTGNGDPTGNHQRGGISEL